MLDICDEWAAPEALRCLRLGQAALPTPGGRIGSILILEGDISEKNSPCG